MPKRDYGAKGRVGVATPQANPTVEPELGACLPPGAILYTARLTSACAQPKDRYLEYYDKLERTLDTFDTLKLDALAYACTASSYLVGHEREDREIPALAKKRGYPIVTGGKAIIAALKKFGARNLAVGAPYPTWVLDACKAYYEAAGFKIVSILQIQIASADTRAIYELTGDDAIAAMKTMNVAGADTILFTGSGMPSFRAILETEKHHMLPTLSTNLCLGWALCDAIGQANWASGSHKLLNGWQDRIARL
jgi:maleate isomerase